MNPRKILTLLLLLVASAQVFAQAKTAELISCPDGKCTVEDQATEEEKHREASTSGENTFCVDIFRAGPKPFIAEISTRISTKVPDKRRGYRTEYVNKVESKSIEKGDNSLDITSPSSAATLAFKSLKGALIYHVNLKPNICKKFSVLTLPSLADALSDYLAKTDSEISSDKIKEMAIILIGLYEKHQEFEIDELDEEDISQYAHSS